MRFIFRPFEHGHPKAYEPLGLLKGITVSLFDMWTKPYSDQQTESGYKDVDTRSDEGEEIYNESVDFDSTFTYLEKPFRIINRVHCSSSSRVPQATIEAEWGEANDERFDRRPIGILDETDMFLGNRWPSGDDGFHNIVVELKKTTETSGSNNLKISIDNVLEGECGFKEEADTEHESIQKYKMKNAPAGKFYVSVWETGTKSVGHYFGEDPENEYYVDWLDGIFFSPFDTSDTENFKVTEEPYYEADEVDGQVKGEISIYLARRRWARYIRTVDDSPTDPAEYVTINIPVSAAYSCQCIEDVSEPLNEDAYFKLWHTEPRPGSAEWYGIGWTIYSYWYNISQSGQGCPSLIMGLDRNGVNGDTWNVTVQHTLGDPCASVENECLKNKAVAGDPSCPCEDANTYNVSCLYTLQSQIIERTYRVALFWECLSTDTIMQFKTGTHETEKNLNYIGYLDNWVNGTINEAQTTFPIGIHLLSESREEAKANALSAGVSQVDVDNIFSGFHSVGTFSIAGDNIVEPGTAKQGSGAREPELVLRKYGNTGCGNYPEKVTLFAYGDGKVFDPLRGSHLFIENYPKPGPGDEFEEIFYEYQRNPGLPCGLGVSPDVEGSLVGIVTEGKSHQRVLYVWRKKDEVFDIKTLSILGNYQGHNISFESHDSRGNTAHTTRDHSVCLEPYLAKGSTGAYYTRVISHWHEKMALFKRKSYPNERFTSSFYFDDIWRFDDEYPSLEFVDQFWHSSGVGRLVTHVGASPDPDNSIYKTVNTQFFDTANYSDDHGCVKGPDEEPTISYYYDVFEYGETIPDDLYFSNHIKESPAYPIVPTPAFGYGDQDWYYTLYNYHKQLGWKAWPSSTGDKHDAGVAHETWGCGDLSKCITEVVRAPGTNKVQLPAPILFVCRDTERSWEYIVE